MEWARIPALTAWVGGGLASAAGCCLLIRAGSLEKHGRVGPAARLSRRGGGLMAAGCLVQAAAGPFLAAPGSAAAAAAASLGAGFVGLLAGLSRKPRPTGTFAVVLFVSSLAAAGLLLSGQTPRFVSDLFRS